MDLTEEHSIGDQHHQQMFSCLNKQRLENRMTDVVLVADEVQFPAHRCVLAAASEYFRSMFEEDHFSESKTKKIQLHSISKDALQEVLELIYLGRLRLSVGNMHTVLAAADHLLLSQAKWCCEDFMQKVLVSDAGCDEVLRVRQTASLFSLSDLKQRADLLIQQKFSQVAKSKAFVELSLEEVTAVISLDDTMETDEYVFFEACVHWIGHMTEARLQYLEQLMALIRFPLMAADILVHKVRCHPWLSKSHTCQAYIQEAMDYQLLSLTRSTTQTPRTRPRCTRHARGLVYCMSATEHFLCYVPASGHWFSLQAPPVHDLITDESQGSSLHLTLLTLQGYVFAGVHRKSPQEVGHMTLLSLMVYDIGENAWKACSLPVEVEETGRVVLVSGDDTMFACSRQSVHRYHLQTDRWELHSSVSLDPCQFVVSCGPCLYFYNLEAGIQQIVWLNKRDCQQTHKQVIMSPNRFIADVQACTKLPHSEVFLQLRTVSGISRKVFNLRTNLWRDCSISHGLAPLQPHAGQHYPLCVDLADPWAVVCDKSLNALYVLCPKSGLSGVPAHTSPRCQDGRLPFYRLDLTSREWKRLPSLPESLAAQDIQLCVADGEDSMAVA